MKRPVPVFAALGIALAGIALTAIATVPASAQTVERAPDHEPSAGSDRQVGHRVDERFQAGYQGRRGTGAPALAALACSPRAGTALETRIDGAADRLELAAGQATLYADFKTAALTAHTQFAETCAAVIEDRPDDLVEALRTRQAMLTARLDAIDAVLPSFEALYDSLTDAQKLELVKMRHAGQRHRHR